LTRRFQRVDTSQSVFGSQDVWGEQDRRTVMAELAPGASRWTYTEGVWDRTQKVLDRSDEFSKSMTHLDISRF
jgi:hypothetical protein